MDPAANTLSEPIMSVIEQVLGLSHNPSNILGLIWLFIWITWNVFPLQSAPFILQLKTGGEGATGHHSLYLSLVYTFLLCINLTNFTLFLVVFMIQHLSCFQTAIHPFLPFLSVLLSCLELALQSPMPSLAYPLPGKSTVGEVNNLFHLFSSFFREDVVIFQRPYQPVAD